MAETTNLGSFIKQCRQELRYSFRKVEELSKQRDSFEQISSSHLVALEQGRYYPSFPKMIALSEIFDVPLDHFVDHYRLDLERRTKVPQDTPVERAEEFAAELIDAGRHKEALKFYQFCLDRLQEPGNGDASSSEKVAKIRYKIGLCRHSMGQLRLAEDELKEVLKTERVSDRTKALACIYLIEIARDQNNIFVAECWATAGENLIKDQEDHLVNAALLNAMGNIKHEAEKTEEALRCYVRALEHLTLTDDEESVGVTRVNIGNCHILLGEPGLGMRHINEGLETLRKVGSRYGEALALTNLTCAFFRAGNFKKVLEYSDHALKIASAESFSDLIIMNYFYKWKTALRLGDEDKVRLYSSRLRFLVKNTEYSIPEVREFKKYIEKEKP